MMTSKILLRKDHAVSCVFAGSKPVYARLFVGHLGLCGRSVGFSVLRRPLPLIMSSRTQKDRGQKQNANQSILSELLKEEENRYCADCAAKGT